MEDFIPDELLKSNNQSLTLYAGELSRYMPGFMGHYISKYCPLSRSGFCYYRSYWNSSHPALKPRPLLRIPLSSIVQVRKMGKVEQEEHVSPQPRMQLLFKAKSPASVPASHFEILLKEGATVEMQASEAQGREKPRDGPSRHRPNDHAASPDLSKDNPEAPSSLMTPREVKQRESVDMSLSALLSPRQLGSEARVLSFF